MNESRRVLSLKDIRYAREGSQSLAQAPVVVDPEVRERGFGPQADYLPFARLYYVDHPEELAAYYQDRENYTYPGGETTRQFDGRGRRKARSYERNKKYERKTVLQVAHSRIIQK